MKEISISELNSSIAELEKQKLTLITDYVIKILKVRYADFPELINLADTLCVLSHEKFEGPLHSMSFTLEKGESMVKLDWFLGQEDSYCFSWTISESEEEVLQKFSSYQGEVIDKLMWSKLAKKLKTTITPAYAFVGFMSKIVCFDENIYRESYLELPYEWSKKEETELPMSQYA